MTDLIVSLSTDKTIDIISKTVDNSISGELIDSHPLPCGGVINVYEKYYYRAENVLTLTATIYSEGANTHVHLVGGGGGSGLFGIDWGASGDFEATIEEALDRYVISRYSNDGAVL